MALKRGGSDFASIAPVFKLAYDNDKLSTKYSNLVE